MRFKYSVAAAASACLFSGFLAAPAFAVDIQEKTARAKDQIPVCTRNLGTVAVREPDNKWWEGLKLDSPEALIKVLVMRSGCFTVLDRGKGFEMMQQERALASGGQLQGGANIGGGQLRAADYILVPDITSKNSNAGRTNVGGLLGGFIGGFAGAVVSGISINSQTADVTLSLGNVRTSEMQAITEGHGDKTDVGFSLGGGGFGGGVFGGAGVSSYSGTAIGQVIILAYIDAYTRMVTQLGGLSAAPAAAAPQQTVTLSRPGVLRATADERGKVVRTLDPGMILYPTGNSDGVWREVSDEVGNKGWVSNASLSLAK
jgi:curli biogenesis system outer membrane secretion channel CsgG